MAWSKNREGANKCVGCSDPAAFGHHTSMTALLSPLLLRSLMHEPALNLGFIRKHLREIARPYFLALFILG